MLARPCARALRTWTPRSAAQGQRSQLYHQFSIPSRPSSQLRRSPILQTSNHQWPQSRRHASTKKAAIKLFKENPITMTLATGIILFGFGMLIYINYYYQTYIIGAFAAFPEPVAVKLRRALYYTNQDLQPKNAIKYYRQALVLADELGMDPFSEEIIGVKIQLTVLFEKCHNIGKAIEVLEVVRSDNLRWIEALGGLERNVGKRTRVLRKTIAISIKLGEYYARDEIQDQEAAEEKLVWAVTALLREQKRRDEEGVKEGEGEWLSNEEIGASLEALGTHYESRSNHYLAAPLYLQALGLCPPHTCHAVTLMSNLAVSLAQQAPPSQFLPSQGSASQITDARQWTQKALAVAAAIKPPVRTPECDEGCAVATINLGDFARMEGDVAEARRRWEEGRGLSKGVGFGEGVKRAEESLRGLGREQ